MSLSDAQQRAYSLLVRVQGGKLAPLDAALLLDCSTRQVRRQVRRLEDEGMAAVVHGNVGRAPQHKTSTQVQERLVALLAEKSKDNVWASLNVCHLQEKLAEKEAIYIGRSTLDRLLVELGLRRRGKSRTERRARREPRSARGMMIQIDGSSHLWFQDRGPRACLMASIDDATSELVYAHFQQSEDQAGYLKMIQQIAMTFGLPMAYYHDRHTILRSPNKPTIEDEIAGTRPMSKFQRVLHDLGIESIAAHSPQAKGRVERLFQTLQDRLLKEMAFERIANCEDANKFLENYLPLYNAKFGRKPKDAEPAWVALDGADIFYYCSICESRVVNKDHTVSWSGMTLQIDGSQMLMGKSVEVRTDCEGEVRIYFEKRRLEYREVQKPVKNVAAAPPKPKSATVTKQEPKAAKQPWLYGSNKSLTPEMADRIQKANKEAELYQDLGHNH